MIKASATILGLVALLCLIQKNNAFCVDEIAMCNQHCSGTCNTYYDDSETCCLGLVTLLFAIEMSSFVTSCVERAVSASILKIGTIIVLENSMSNIMYAMIAMMSVIVTAEGNASIQRNFTNHAVK